MNTGSIIKSDCLRVCLEMVINSQFSALRFVTSVDHGEFPTTAGGWLNTERGYGSVDYSFSFLVTFTELIKLKALCNVQLISREI